MGQLAKQNKRGSWHLLIHNEGNFYNFSAKGNRDLLSILDQWSKVTLCAFFHSYAKEAKGPWFACSYHCSWPALPHAFQGHAICSALDTYEVRVLVSQQELTKNLVSRRWGTSVQPFKSPLSLLVRTLFLEGKGSLRDQRQQEGGQSLLVKTRYASLENLEEWNISDEFPSKVYHSWLCFHVSSSLEHGDDI